MMAFMVIGLIKLMLILERTKGRMMLRRRANTL